MALILLSLAVSSVSTILSIHETKESRDELYHTKEELRQARKQLETIMKCPAMASTQLSPQLSYADMARMPPTG
jgi:hypothetical protein